LWTRAKSEELIVTKQEDWNDEQLLDRLGAALDAADPVPPEVVAAAKSVVPRLELELDVDAIIAEVVFDSATSDLVGVRGTQQEARELTLSAPGVEIELVVLSDGARRLVGQLVPPQTGVIELTSGEEARTASADSLGRFTFVDVPEGPIRLSCRLDEGDQIIETNWLVI
jgi:hypothetical protein